MNKFESRIGEYANWSESQRHTFLRELKRMIKKNTIYGASLSVNCDDYDSLIQGDIRAEWGKTYYGFCVRLLLKHFGEWATKHNYQDFNHYVFAELPSKVTN